MNPLVCQQCNAELEPNAKFCHVCGFKIQEKSEENQIPVQETGSQTNSASVDQEQVDFKTFTDVKSDEVFSAVKSGNIFKRAINIMFKPRQEWTVVADEKPRIPLLIFGYTLIFSIIPVLTLMIKNSFYHFGYKFHFGFAFQGTIYGLALGLLFAIAAIAAIIVAALIINALSTAFKTEKNFGRAMQLTTYSFTPMFFAASLYLIPFLSFLVFLAGLYGIFILLIGQPLIMKTPKNNQIGYFFTSIGILYGLFFTIYWTSTVILHTIYRGFFHYW